LKKKVTMKGEVRSRWKWGKSIVQKGTKSNTNTEKDSFLEEGPGKRNPVAVYPLKEASCVHSGSKRVTSVPCSGRSHPPFSYYWDRALSQLPPR
jgi:hypothetical protein